VDLQTGIHVWFIHEGDLSHLLLAFRGLLNNLFPEDWIGGGGPKARRARSPDLNPLYFHLWRYLKSISFLIEFIYAQDLQKRMQNGVELIRTTCGMCRPVRQSQFRSATFCIEAQDRHSEHFL